LGGDIDCVVTSTAVTSTAATSTAATSTAATSTLFILAAAAGVGGLVLCLAEKN
jgi:hypothetical protein